MSDRVTRTDLVGAIVPPQVEECPHCGADLRGTGECSANCNASRRAREDEARREVRQG